MSDIVKAQLLYFHYFIHKYIEYFAFNIYKKIEKSLIYFMLTIQK